MNPIAKLNAGRLTAALAGLLALAYLLVLSGRIAEDRAPIAANSSPYGTSALRAVLEASGYRVRVESNPRAKIAPDELVIGFDATRPETSGRDVADKGPKLTDRLPKGVRRAMVVGVGDPNGDLGKATAETGESGRTFRLALLPTDMRVPELHMKNGIIISRLTRDGEELAYVAGPPERRVLSLAHGEMALNKGIDQGENASYLLGIVRAFAPGKSVVLFEGLNESGDGLLSALGDWAFAARNQAFLVLGTLLVALGSRFGIAPKPRRRETGQREQSDALGNLLRRWRGPAIGIEAGVEQARRRLVKARRLPASAPREQWTKYLSVALLARFDDCDEWVRQDAREGEALTAIARLDAAVESELERPKPI